MTDDDGLSPDDIQRARNQVRRRLAHMTLTEAETELDTLEFWHRHVSKSDAGGMARIIRAEVQADEAHQIVTQMRQRRQQKENQ